MTAFYLTIANYIIAFDGKIAFGFSLCVCGVAFVISLILSVCSSKYTLKKRLWVLALFMACIANQVACDINSGWSQVLSLNLFAILLALTLPTFMIPLKQKTITQNQLDFVKFMDSKLHFADVSAKQNTPKPTVIPNFNVNTPSNCDAQIQQNPSPQQVQTLDFSHVKNVINRLDNFTLAPADKKQVKELQMAIARAENGEHLPDVKRCVNDGLGALLKIMSKYGV